MIEVGDRFPAFSLADQNGKLVTLNDLAGKKAIIYFYPKDDTSGCTLEACEFRDLTGGFAGARILGVSPDSAKSHRKFADKFALMFTLLADTDRALCNSVGVWVEKSMYGKKYMGVARTTFLLDESGVVTKIWTKVNPSGHAADVASSLK